MDLSSAQAIKFVDIRQISLSAGTSTQFKVQYSTNDVTYTDAATVPLIGTNPQNFRLLLGQTARYWRLARIGATDLGTAKVTLAGLSLYEESAILSTPRLVDMSVEDDRHYLVEFTRDNIRIYRTPNTRVADIKPTYSGLTSAQIENIRVAQVENVMLIVGDFAPMRLVNLGTNDDWVIDEIPFTNVPQYDFDDALSPTPTSEIQVMTLGHTGSGQWKKGDRFEVDIESVLSKSISFAGDSTADERASTVFNIQKNLQEMPVFGETGVAVARTGTREYTTISGESTKDFELFSAYVTEGSADHDLSLQRRNLVCHAKRMSGLPPVDIQTAFASMKADWYWAALSPSLNQSSCPRRDRSLTLTLMTVMTMRRSLRPSHLAS